MSTRYFSTIAAIANPAALTPRKPRPDYSPALDDDDEVAERPFDPADDAAMDDGLDAFDAMEISPYYRAPAPVAPRVTTQLHAGGGFGITIVGTTPEAIRDALAAELLANRDFYRAALDAAADEHHSYVVADLAAREVARV